MEQIEIVSGFIDGTIIPFIEPYFNLSWLVSVGEFYGGLCVDKLNGLWAMNPDGTYQCVVEGQTVVDPDWVEANMAGDRN